MSPQAFEYLLVAALLAHFHKKWGFSIKKLKAKVTVWSFAARHFPNASSLLLLLMLCCLRWRHFCCSPLPVFIGVAVSVATATAPTPFLPLPL
jgi:hypothetical protein